MQGIHGFAEKREYFRDEKYPRYMYNFIMDILDYE